MKEVIKRLNKLCPKSILTLAQRKRLVDALGESLADIAEKNLTKSKLFSEDKQHGRNRKLSEYITADERKEIAGILNDPIVVERIEQSLRNQVIAGIPFVHAMEALTIEELTTIIGENDH